jgi:hypothetical protein
MTKKRILFDKFEFPVIKGLKYLSNDKNPSSDYLFINEVNDDFSMHFEKDFPIFTVPENLERNYCLFELKRTDKIIKFFCPEKQRNIDSAVWYFYVKFIDLDGSTHTLPGQVRVAFKGVNAFEVKGIPKFIEVLDKVKIQNQVTST